MMCRMRIIQAILWGLVWLSAGPVQAETAPSSSRFVRGQVPQSGPAPQRARVVTTEVTAQAEISAIAVIGEVNRPGVFLTEQVSVPLKTLLEKAGGETQNSVGTFRILEYGETREAISLNRDPNRKITSGQVLLVVPRGGMIARSGNAKSPIQERHVLIHGLAEVPLLLKLPAAVSTLQDLTRALGQPYENLSRTMGSLPQGGWMSSPDIRLASGSVILFDDRVVNQTGVQLALARGLKFQPEISLDTPPAPATARPVAPQPPEAPPSNRPAPLPKSASLDPELTIPSKIQTTAVGEDVEPLWAPADESIETAPASESGRVPLRMPQGWKIDDSASEATIPEAPELEDPLIERTSAGADDPTFIQHASAAQLQPNHETPREFRTGRSLAELSNGDPSPEVAPRPNRYSAPAPNPYWIGFVALFAGIVMGLGVVLARTPREMEPTSLVDEALSKFHAESSSATLESDPQTLQRLILNRVPIVEESPELPKCHQLHGPALGNRRMVVHEAHEGVAGPHFTVPQPGSTRAIELRLRSVMREIESRRPVLAGTHSRDSIVDIPSKAALAERIQRVSPLERALRSVERGEAQ